MAWFKCSNNKELFILSVFKAYLPSQWSTTHEVYLKKLNNNQLYHTIKINKASSYFIPRNTSCHEKKKNQTSRACISIRLTYSQESTIRSIYKHMDILPIHVLLATNVPNYRVRKLFSAIPSLEIINLQKKWRVWFPSRFEISCSRSTIYILGC